MKKQTLSQTTDQMRDFAQTCADAYAVQFVEMGERMVMGRPIVFYDRDKKYFAWCSSQTPLADNEVLVETISEPGIYGDTGDDPDIAREAIIGYIMSTLDWREVLEKIEPEETDAGIAFQKFSEWAQDQEQPVYILGCLIAEFAETHNATRDLFGEWLDESWAKTGFCARDADTYVSGTCEATVEAARNWVADEDFAEFVEFAHSRDISLSTPYDRAKARVDASPELSAHSDTILYDWPEGDEHFTWVATAPINKIVDWAETIESQGD